jgi:hypothetical protein
MRQNSVGTTKIEPAINLSLSGSHDPAAATVDLDSGDRGDIHRLS